ncbi:MAG TPA: beta-propeller fold lactonase family protein [Streptosporangiaceae bacterium]|jgi:6-phosphogluconolactonase (cycloisomerase 2 family)
MRSPRRIASAAALTTAALGTFAFTAASASAATSGHDWATGASHAVFVQTDNLSGNQVVAYDRAADGTLTWAGTYNTKGLGGQLTGSVVDHVASQGSLVYDQAHNLLYAVNAGSNTVSVFAASGDQLHLTQVIGSGGTFPVSIAVHGDLVYVANALNGGSVQGYRVSSGRLQVISGSNRPLNLSTTATPQFTNTPGQVAFTPNGLHLIVTTKANGDNIDVFGVGVNGYLSAQPVVNNEPNEVPFGIAFDPAGHLVIAESATNSAVATFAVHPDGQVTQLDQVLTGQAATCWVAEDFNHAFADNAGSASVSSLTVSKTDQLTLNGNTSTDPGTVDAAVAPHGRFLYVQTGGNGIVDEFSVDGGHLSEIGSVTVPGAVGGEGIVAA